MLAAGLEEFQTDAFLVLEDPTAKELPGRALRACSESHRRIEKSYPLPFRL